jgi:hypothetical protein
MKHKKFIQWSGSMLIGLFMAYSIAVHYFSWFSQSKNLKISILLLSIPVCVIAVFSIIKLFTTRFSPDYLPRKLLIMGGAVTLLLSILFFRSYRLIPIQTMHNLIISSTGQKDIRADAFHVEVRGINIPVERKVPVKDIQLTGEYSISGSTILFTDVNSQAWYQEEFLGDSVVEFRTGPASGVAMISWDGKQQEINLYSEWDGNRQVVLTGRSFGQPRLLWRMLAYAATISDISTIIFTYLQI